MALTTLGTAIDLNAPGRYLHWSIFTVSVANLVLIAVMVVIFGVALLAALPAPAGRRRRAHRRTRRDRRPRRSRSGRPRRSGHVDVPAAPAGAAAAAAGQAPARPPARLRRLVGLRLRRGLAWPPSAWRSSRVSPSRSAAPTGGTPTRSATSSTACTCGASSCSWPSWSSTSGASSGWPPGAAGGALTWITGVVAFVASIVECFTGYLSQQNFDSQWISTNGKDAINAIGVGAFFNLMNFGQMLLWHVVLIPIVLVALVGAHVLLVRVRGVSHPLPLAARPRPGGAAGRRRGGRRRVARPDPPLRHREGGRRSPRSSPSCSSCSWPASCPRPTTRRSRSPAGPGWHRPTSSATAASELAGTSETASYGPPYNHQSGQRPAPRPPLADSWPG